MGGGEREIYQLYNLKEKKSECERDDKDSDDGDA